MENSVAVPQKLNTDTIWPGNSTPKCTPERNKSICSHKDLHTNIYGIIIHNSQKVGTIQVFINWWTVKQHVVYPQNEILFSHAKELIHLEHGWIWKYYILNTKAITEDQMYDFIYMKCPLYIYREIRQRSFCLWLEETGELGSHSWRL